MAVAIYTSGDLKDETADSVGFQQQAKRIGVLPPHHEIKIPVLHVRAGMKQRARRKLLYWFAVSMTYTL